MSARADAERARIVAAAVEAIREGHVLHVRAPREPAARRCYLPAPEIDLTVGPCHLRGWSVEDYSPAWTTVARRRVRTRRNDREDFDDPGAAIKRAMMLLTDRVEYLRAALCARFADELAAEQDERERRTSLWITESLRMHAAADVARRFGLCGRP